MERGSRPRDGAPKYVESWSTGESASRSEGQPTVCSDRKAAVLDATRQVFRTPPGSESGAGLQRGDSGTWESQWCPWVKSGAGVPTIAGKTPGVERRCQPLTRAVREGTQSKRRDTRYRGRRGRTERPRDGPLAVLAEHSTAGQEPSAPGWEGGAPQSQGPPAGKAKPGITFFWQDLWERLRAHQPYPCNSRTLQSRHTALRRWCSTTCFT
jgi:hypothetical protein